MRFKYENKILIFSLFLGLAAWVFDAAIDVLFFDKGLFLDLLILDVPAYEIYVRGLFVAGLLIFGIVISRMFGRRRRAEEAVLESEARLQMAQDFANAGTWEWDLSTGSNYWSPKVWELYGLEPGSCRASYESWKNTIHPDDQQKTEETVKAAALAQAELNAEWRVRQPDGSYKWLMSRGRPLFSKAGQAVKYIGIVLDITERKQMEDAMQVALDRYRSYMDVSGQLGWTTDAAGEVVEDLPVWRAYTGQSFDEILGCGWIRALHPEDVEYVSRRWKDAVDGRKRYEVEYRILRHDGIYRHFMVCGIPVFKEDGSVREWVGTCIDVTDLRGAADELQKAKDELEVRVRARTEELTAANRELQKERDLIKVTNTLLELYVKNMSFREYLNAVVEIVITWSECCCLGIRILDERGNLPYWASAGFSQEFIEADGKLMADTDWECSCMRVVMQRPDPLDLASMTPFGSFYTNDSPGFLQDVKDEEKPRFMGVCARCGFRSVAIIPIRYQEGILGVIHLADDRKDMVPLKKVEFMETLSHIVGGAIHKFRAEEELVKSQDGLRSLATHMQTMRENERTTIAREIHDELGQILTALKIDLSRIHDIAGTNAEIAEKSKIMIGTLNMAIRAVKRITTELRPGTLDYLSISEAIEWQAREFEKRTGISCEVASHPQEITIDKDISINVFRIFQEILTNISNHSGATQISVRLENTDGQMAMVIEDNGKGVTDEQLASPTAFGIIGMRERVRFLQGEITIKGEPGRGTAISVVVPVHGPG